MAMQQPSGVEGGPAPSAPSKRIDPAALGKAVPPRLEGPPGSVFYRLGLLLVAVAMVLLPLAYLGLVGLAGYGVYWHATEHTSWLAGAGVRLRLLVYAAPIVAGAIVVFFLLKPLFSKPVVSEEFRPLRKEEAPLLFALVRRVAAAVGAPAPDRIDVDCQVNASAGRHRHEGGKQLVLTVGLPLVAGLSLRELTGVIPRDAYLTSFRMRQGKVEIDGFSREASELIPAIEKSKYFSAAQFTSPVTKARDNEERFSLSARIAE